MNRLPKMDEEDERDIFPEEGLAETEGRKQIDFGLASKISKARGERAAKAALKDYFRQLGLSEQEVEEALLEFRDNSQGLEREWEEKVMQGENAITQGNRRSIDAEAAIQAAVLGVKPQRIRHLIKLADISGLDMDPSGVPPIEGIRDALERVLDEFPELRAKSFGSHGANPANQNLTREQQLIRDIKEAREKGNMRDVIHMKQLAAKEGLFL